MFITSLQNGLDDDEEEEDDTEDDSFGYEGEATEDDLNEVNSDLDLENLQVEAKSELILQRCQIAATQIVCGREEEESQSQSTSQLLSQAESESLSADQPRDCLAPQKVSLRIRIRIQIRMICIFPRMLYVVAVCLFV